MGCIKINDFEPGHFFGFVLKCNLGYSTYRCFLFAFKNCPKTEALVMSNSLPFFSTLSESVTCLEFLCSFENAVNYEEIDNRFYHSIYF